MFPLLILLATGSPFFVILNKDSIFYDYNSQPIPVDFQNMKELSGLESKHIILTNACVSENILTVTKESVTFEFIPVRTCDSVQVDSFRIFLNINSSLVKNKDSVWSNINSGIYEGKLKECSSELDFAADDFNESGIRFDSDNCYEIVAGYNPGSDYDRYGHPIVFLGLIPFGSMVTLFLLRRDQRRKKEAADLTYTKSSEDSPSY